LPWKSIAPTQPGQIRIVLLARNFGGMSRIKRQNITNSQKERPIRRKERNFEPNQTK
jgi:hypothetical protein